MTHEQFNETTSKTLKQLEDVLVKKGEEYSGGQKNRFHNFIQAGLKQGESKERALMGMLTKHLVSIDDMIDLQEAKELIPEKMINEKLNDALVYYLILKAMFLAELPLNENSGHQPMDNNHGIDLGEKDDHSFYDDMSYHGDDIDYIKEVNENLLGAIDIMKRSKDATDLVNQSLNDKVMELEKANNLLDYELRVLRLKNEEAYKTIDDLKKSNTRLSTIVTELKKERYDLRVAIEVLKKLLPHDDQKNDTEYLETEITRELDKSTTSKGVANLHNIQTRPKVVDEDVKQYIKNNGMAMIQNAIKTGVPRDTVTKILDALYNMSDHKIHGGFSVKSIRRVVVSECSNFIAHPTSLYIFRIDSLKRASDEELRTIQMTTELRLF